MGSSRSQRLFKRDARINMRASSQNLYVDYTSAANICGKCGIASRLHYKIHCVTRAFEHRIIKARDIIHRYPIIRAKPTRCSVYLITVTYVLIFSRERRRRRLSNVAVKGCLFGKLIREYFSRAFAASI